MLQNNIWTTTKDVIGFKTSHTNKAEWFDDECRTALETGRKARETYMRTRKEKHQKQYQQDNRKKNVRIWKHRCDRLKKPSVSKEFLPKCQTREERSSTKSNLLQK